MKTLVVGSANYDSTYTLDKLPVKGETILAKAKYTSIGGKGLNQAVALRRLGASVSFIGAVGNDSTGDLVTSYLEEEGIDTTGLIRKDVPTGEAVILVDGDGDNMIIPFLGANNELTPSDIDRYESIFDEVDVCIMQYEIPLETVAHVIKLCKEKDVMVVVDPAPASLDLSFDVLSEVDYLMPNETELEILSGKKVTLDNIESVCSEMLENGIKRLVVTMGEHGAYYMDSDTFLHVPSRKVEVVDTTAAGDTFAGAFVVKILEGKSVKEAIEFANTASAVTIGIEGTLAGVSTLEFQEKLQAYL